MELAAKYEIAEMDLTDVDGIVSIEQVSFPSPWPKRVFEREIESERSYKRVIRFEGTVVGYIVTWSIYDEIHILNIAIHPDFRRIGLGETLIRDCIAYSKEHDFKYIILEVRPSNAGALKLYAKLGFRKLRVRRKYYSDTGEDAIVMIYEVGALGVG